MWSDNIMPLPTLLILFSLAKYYAITPIASFCKIGNVACWRDFFQPVVEGE